MIYHNTSVMKKIIEQYKSSLKDSAVDEILDLILFRPLAFLVVKVVYHLPITPNQLSFFSILSGILCAIFFSRGMQGSNFVIAGLLYGLTRIFDCSDGMIARLKKTGTATGRIIDGVVDYINAVVIYIGLAIGLANSNISFPVSSWILVLLAGISMAFHSIVIDFYKSEYLAHALRKKKSTLEEKEVYSHEMKLLKGKKGRYFDKWLIRAYLHYLDLQVGRKQADRRREYDSEAYGQANKYLLWLWSIIGSSAYIFFLMVASLIAKPSLFFIYSPVFANAWLGVIWLVQIRRNKKLISQKPG